MKTQPPKGMRDILPAEEEVRDLVLSRILDGYKKSGFFQISTPIMEDSENIASSDGGENLSLVFDILKRGDKLKDALENKGKLNDFSLRYDLTLPLSRFYSANKEKLMLPFRAIQTGSVFRAERPQRGRLREFRQCDIDIIGDESINAEIEILPTTLTVLQSLGFKDLEVRVNDRRILYKMLEDFGFKTSQIFSVCITLDKVDKIGISGVCAELEEKDFSKESILKVQNYLNDLNSGKKFKIKGKELGTIVDSLSKLSDGLYKIVYSPSLIRGQGYYTGFIAEVYSSTFNSAIAGGGRYDGMIAKFLGTKLPSVGFSIGFERIMSIILDDPDWVLQIIGNRYKKVALMYNENDNFLSVMQKKQELLKTNSVAIFKETKNKKKFFDDLLQLGFCGIYYYSTGEYKELRAK